MHVGMKISLSQKIVNLDLRTELTQKHSVTLILVQLYSNAI